MRAPHKSRGEKPAPPEKQKRPLRTMSVFTGILVLLLALGALGSFWKPAAVFEPAAMTPTPELTYVLEHGRYSMLFPKRPSSGYQMLTRNSLGVEYHVDAHTYRDNTFWIALACHDTAEKYDELYPDMTREDILLKYQAMYQMQGDMPVVITGATAIAPTEHRWELRQRDGEWTGVGRAILADKDTFIVLGLADEAHKDMLTQCIDSLLIAAPE